MHVSHTAGAPEHLANKLANVLLCYSHGLALASYCSATVSSALHAAK